MEKPIIIFGKTGSGKTTLAKALEKEGFERIITYTTRPMRKGEIDGVDYFFISEEQFKNYIQLGMFAEWKEYDASFGHCYYGSMKADYICDKPTVLILTLSGLIDVKKSGIDVMSYYLDIDDKNQRRRLLLRGDSYAEIQRRVGADRIDFAGSMSYADYCLDGTRNIEALISYILATRTIVNLNKKIDNNGYIHIDDAMEVANRLAAEGFFNSSCREFEQEYIRNEFEQKVVIF